MSDGFASSKVLRIQQRAEGALKMINEVPMNEERKWRHLNRAMHDIVKISKEELDGTESS